MILVHICEVKRMIISWYRLMPGKRVWKVHTDYGIGKLMFEYINAPNQFSPFTVVLRHLAIT